MIERLRVEHIYALSGGPDKGGWIGVRYPDIQEVVDKVNDIIDYLNEKEKEANGIKES